MRLSTLLDMAADGFGDRVLIGGRKAGITGAELARRSHAGAHALRERGAGSLVYLGVNGPAFPVALFAAARAGIPLVPLNFRLGEQQLAALLTKHPNALGVADPGARIHLERAGIPSITPQEWLETAASGCGRVEEPGDDGDGDGVAAVIYTSGTTSEPKGVLLRHSNLVSYVLGTVEFAAAGEEEAALVSVPPYHIAAVANVITNLFAGRRTVVIEGFTPTEWLRTVRDEAVTNAMVVPTMLARLVESDQDVSLPSLRSLSYGGAPMPGPVIEKALATWPEVGFVNAYGLTETSSTIALLGPEDHRRAQAATDPDGRARLRSAGRALPGVEIEIRDPEGNLLGPLQPGRVFVRGGQISAEYAGVGRALDAQGFFDTRDEGYLDAEGYLFLGGRTDDTIIRGAENVAPAEIEEVLLRHPQVQDAAVFGVTDREWGQRIEAAVVSRPGSPVDAGELRDFTRLTLRSSRTPDRFWFVEELPRTETGKLIRRRVADAVARANGADGVPV
ncbi:MULTISPECIES: class I adenylate-forming enzyme family protein [Streptacidiphilus]|uniref:Class I adenylate-forming enzyme family protein n=1 Tax=Streptacidiphilus cavernicola TaxID=3342716 RepID=A0ABV6UUW3_9ACTN|nr:class I adenylate-forming enzyme family protein [Streptacidiphilus jeojiense]